MTTYRLTTRQFIARPIEEVFAFFAEPRNLGRITPSSMGFEFLSDDFEMREGLAIDYRLRPLFGVPTRWRTEITDYNPPFSFHDIQASGPYKRWDHHHTFESVPGGTVARDDVEYELPLGPLGAVGQALVVRTELQKIFSHRARIIERVFADSLPNEAPVTVAVAGGTGFVGGAIARELHHRGENVVVLSQRGEEARAGLPDAVELRVADASVRSEALVEALAGIDVLVIALAFKNLPIEAPRRGRTFMKVDAAGTENLVDAARVAGVKHIIYMSGAGADCNAKRHWFRAKWRAEQAVRESRSQWTIVRPTWVYGPDDVSLNRFLGFAHRLPFVPMSNFGRQRLAPVFVDDVANLVADSLRDPNAVDQTFELGGPDTFAMRDVIAHALRVAQIRRPILPAPAPLIKLAVAPLVLLPSPPMTPDAIDFVNQPAEVDIRPLLERMPRRLTKLDEGLATYLAPGSGPGELHFETVTKDEARIDAVDVAHV
jgi:NADH dehydrogenase